MRLLWLRGLCGGRGGGAAAAEVGDFNSKNGDIMRFTMGFSGILGFQLGFWDFNWDFRTSIGILINLIGILMRFTMGFSL